jgi:hypothetical protein
MAKKNTAVDERKAIQEEDTSLGHDEFPNGVGADEFKFDTEFNVEEEYKIPPLVPAGKYEGFVTNVFFSASDNALVWDVTLKADNDVLMSDNEMPVNGNVMVYKNWFPKSGDENIRTKTGKMTKRQAKINMIADFSKKMRIDMNSPEAILDGVSNSEWIGLEVIVEVEVREYEGRLSNQIKNMSAA